MWRAFTDHITYDSSSMKKKTIYFTFFGLKLTEFLLFMGMLRSWMNRASPWTKEVMTKFPPLKGARSDHFRFFSNFQRFWYQKKIHIFLITPGEFYSWKMYRLEDINENVTSYGNHNYAYTIRYRQLKIRNLSLCPNGLTDWNEIWNQDILGDDASFE